MLVILSPAKSLDFDSPIPTDEFTEPLNIKHSKELMDILSKYSKKDLMKLMGISEKLADLNFERNQGWTKKHTLDNSRQAILAYDGDVYEGLQARALPLTKIKWAQSRVAILSGLYGVLRPLDLIQPHRLEMGTKIKNPAGADLYRYWSKVVTPLVINLVEQSSGSKVLVNLASDEYFKALDSTEIKDTGIKIVKCIFQELRGDIYKIISFNAKKARGLMTRFIIDNKVTKPEGMQGFDLEGYRFDAEVSDEVNFYFRRTL
ncbi:peroxide stress protein YaaA [Taylorella equigenitalis]|uniref:peroxide stress protein YaaA n=1 Tax=Taylorella equigenitalis TaxID=29575 RepID=UPI0004041424|nr:peroxide stress protein YaaA [Taylorella equigenitalis]ASY41106.1 peroxide stress protein YaaA [Taylorella equigenitalis]